MNNEWYQMQAMRTRRQIYDKEKELCFSALEIASEAGEVANLVYKWVFQGHTVDVDKMKEELGDLLWGVASMCTACGLQIDDAMMSNIAKLAKRYPSGFFTVEDSIARKDHDESKETSEDQQARQVG